MSCPRILTSLKGCSPRTVAEHLASFWSYELSKRYTTVEGESDRQAALKVLLCGGLAGVVTWASIFPLDVIKTRVQMQVYPVAVAEHQPLLITRQQSDLSRSIDRRGAFEIAKRAYREEGAGVFFRGLGVCSLRAFIVNAVQVRLHVVEEDRDC